MSRRLAFLVLFFAIGCQHSNPVSKVNSAPSPAVRPVKSPESGALPLYDHLRQLTFVGPRSGEGYFSADGKNLIFQSEREPGNPFYQIYLMDLITGKTRRVSNGQGKTTCAWVHPNGEKALYASTHLDPKWKAKAEQELAMRSRGERPKYSWSYDEYFDLYETDLKTGRTTALIPSLGYDAEGDYSPDGQWIVFSSNRHAYSGKLTPEDLKRREEDPSYFLEIYLMRADGTGLKRLTDVAGYDGGPFFSADGKKITWRRFSTDGRVAEVWTMNADGGEPRQITRLGAMSWAPFYHPSGDYLIFTTNLQGYDNFELYIVDREGDRAPVRVTEWSGFDGLPVFSPDGRTLSWTHRNEKGESQIYRAEWNDLEARRRLNLKPRLNEPKIGAPSLSQSEARDWVEYLASAEMKGRRTGSPEEAEYSKVIADRMKAFGLKPLMGSSFIEPFEYRAGIKLGEGNSLKVTDQRQTTSLNLSQDWIPLSFSPSGDFSAAPVAFAGYGIVAPANADQPEYNSYQGLDIKGRWAMVLRDLPSEIDNARRFHLNLYSRLQHKALVAKQAGAVGVLIVHSGSSPLALKYEGSDGETALPVVEISEALAEQFLKETGKPLKDWRAALSHGEVGGAKIDQWQVRANIRLLEEKANARNVIGEIKVPGAKGTIVIGAHGDHLGMGQEGNSLAKPEERNQIHFGADDNASGVAAVMELAHYFTEEVRSGRLKPRYNLAFAVWSGEEIGVLGSTRFLRDYRASKIVTYLNLDMVGRLRDKLLIQGVASAQEWVSLIESLALSTKVPLSLQDDPYLPTDALSFYLKGIPSISFFTGAHAEYHSPRDRAETLNYEGLIETAKVVADVARTVATKAPLTYRKVEGGQNPTGGRGFRLYLGTIPDYSQEGIQGVRISGTTKASPAEKAGLKEGDVIVELGGTRISNLQDYVYCLQSMKANEKTSIKVLRQGRQVNLEIVPALKGM